MSRKNRFSFEVKRGTDLSITVNKSVIKLNTVTMLSSQP